MTLRVLSVASEAAPLVKTGGLADVVGALPDAVAVEMAARTGLGDIEFTAAYERGRAATLSTVEQLASPPPQSSPER